MTAGTGGTPAALAGLAALAGVEGDTGHARAPLEKSLALATELGDSRRAGSALAGPSRLAGEVDEAAAWLRRALSLGAVSACTACSLGAGDL